MTYLFAALIVFVVFTLGVQVGRRRTWPRAFMAGASARKLTEQTGNETTARVQVGARTFVFVLKPGDPEDERPKD